MKILILAFLLILALLLTVNSARAASLTLTWDDNSTNEQGFNIYRREAPLTSQFVEIDSVGPDISTWIDINVIEEVVYCYEVKAYNAEGESAAALEKCAMTKTKPPDVPPGPPGRVTFKIDVECVLQQVAKDNVIITCPAPAP